MERESYIKEKEKISERWKANKREMIPNTSEVEVMSEKKAINKAGKKGR